MVTTPEQRDGIDRRAQPRGGRRPNDLDGFSPLVMLVGEGPAVGDMAEAVLAKLRFGVAATPNADDALRVLTTLRPDIIVASGTDAGRIRLEAPEHLSVVAMTDDMRGSPHLLVDAIRESIRANQPG
ncbi:MAG: hypothetical protein H0U94_07395 [Acidobacteria bacterium]|jgi:hypothetical protein|nr:hypothetical protein [Acidobacteriota bacterium]